MSKKRLRENFDTYCSICGFPVMKHQIGTVIDDLVLMDFNERIYVDFSAHICSECWESIKSNNIGGMDRAIKKRKLLLKADGKDRIR